MSNQVKKGRAPISEKNKENSDFLMGGMERSLLRLDPAIKAELKEKGLEYRWISRKKFQEDGNFHINGYVPYRFESLKKQSSEFSLGSSPEGYLIRREMVLAVIPQEERKRQQARVKFRTDAQSQVVKQAAQDLKKSLGPSGAKIYEGYEENGGAESDDD